VIAGGAFSFIARGAFSFIARSAFSFYDGGQKMEG
jgi:hypothetical protein